MHLTSHAKSFSIFFLCFLFVTLAHTQTLEDKIDQLIEAEYHINEPGATALVAKNGEVIYRKAFGQADLELGIAMIPENVFEIGSVTKQFTATSILILMEQGKLKLDDDITTFIPDYPTDGKTITVHHLLTHTSGVKSYTDMPSFDAISKKDLSPLEMIDFFKNEPLDFDPGEDYHYSNSGFFLLGYIIEKVSGQTYAEFVQEHIFDKIDMSSSHYGSHSTLIKNRASGYQQDNEEYVNTQYISMSLPYAAGSLMSTVDDLLKWQMAINNNTFVKRTTIEKAFTNHTLNDGEQINYGYGWSLSDLNGVPTIEHGGGIPGYTTMSIYVPSEDVYVVILTNCDCNPPTETAVKIAAEVIGKPYPEIAAAIELSAKEQQQWLGAYEFKNEVIRFIILKDGGFYSQREGSSLFKIFPISKNEFFFEDGLISYTFSHKNEKKQATFKNRGHASIGIESDKVPAPESESIAVESSILEQYIGKYELQPGFIMDVTTVKDQIFIQLTGQPKFEIFAKSASSFFLKVVVASIDFNMNDKGEVVSLILHQGGQDMEAKKMERNEVKRGCSPRCLYATKAQRHEGFNSSRLSRGKLKPPILKDRL